MAMMNRFWAHSCTLLWTFLAVSVLASPAAAQELVPGSAMPMADVAMSDVDGGEATLARLAGEQGTVVIFWSNQCPWIQRYEERLIALTDSFAPLGLSFVLVNSNDGSAFPQESPAESRATFERSGFPSGVAYLIDPTSELARSFGAERTPHAFVFDESGVLVYMGAIDDSPGDPANVSARYLRSALDAVVSGADVAVPQTKAFGCTIKFNG